MLWVKQALSHESGNAYWSSFLNAFNDQFFKFCHIKFIIIIKERMNILAERSRIVS